MRYGKHIILLDPKVNPKQDAAAITYPHVDSRLDAQLKNSFQEKPKFYHTTWIWESFNFLSSEKGLKSLQTVASFPKERVFSNIQQVKKYVKLWKHLEKTQQRKTLLEKTLLNQQTNNQHASHYYRSLGQKMSSQRENVLRKQVLLSVDVSAGSQNPLTLVLKLWDDYKSNLSLIQRTKLLNLTTSILLLSPSDADKQYGKFWWAVQRNPFDEIRDYTIDSFPTLLDSPNVVFLRNSTKLRNLLPEVTDENSTQGNAADDLINPKSGEVAHPSVNLVSPFGAKMSPEDYNSHNEKMLSDLITKYSNLATTIETKKVKYKLLSLLKAKLNELKSLKEEGVEVLRSNDFTEKVNLLQTLIDNQTFSEKNSITTPLRASILSEDLWSHYWDLTCENPEETQQNTTYEREVKLLHWLLLQSFVQEWSSEQKDNDSHLTSQDDKFFEELSSELNRYVLLSYSNTYCETGDTLQPTDHYSTKDNLSMVINDLALKVSAISSEYTPTRSNNSALTKSASNLSLNSNESGDSKRENMTAEEKLRADAQEKAYKVDEVKHDRYDINFLRKEYMFTKLKYSRCPQYDAVSGGFAALFAGFIGFLISEKFGIELVDSGDFYVGLMYILFASFIFRLFVFSTTDSIDETPAFFLSFYPIKLFYKELLLTLVKRVKSFLSN